MGESSSEQSGRPGTAFSDADIRSVIGRSSTLAERLTSEFVPTGQGLAVAAKRLARWKHLAADGDEVVFRRVLGMMGLSDSSDEELLSLLGEVRPAGDADVPRWAVLLQEIVPEISAAFSTGDDLRPGQSPGTNRLIPFAKLYSPIVALARRKAETTLCGQGEWMCNEAWRGLESWLRERISSICSLALQPKFMAYKAVRRTGPMLARFEKNPQAENDGAPDSLFDSFVNEQGRQGLFDFFMNYPTAARLSAQVAVFWIDFVTEFLGRLEVDAGEIRARFAARRPLGKIARINAGISDLHRRGRSVLVVNFESGVRLVYKPRPMQIDAAFSDLLSWLNAQGHTPTLRPLDVLTREDYGWEDFVEHSPCRNRREAKQFFRRAGGLLYLVHALRGVDFHRDNVIATAEGPVLVDLEALCHPPFPETVMVKNGQGGQWEYNASVFRTGMLPVPGRRPDGGRYSNLSALAGAILQRSPATDIRWKNINSDQMQAAPGSTRMICATHRARLRGRLLSIRDHGKELVDGFQRMARLFRRDERAARQWQAAVAAMNGMATRLVERPTFLYSMMIGRSLQPRYLVEGVDRSIEFQALPPPTGDEDDRRGELAALEVLDVPIFFRQPGTDTTAGRGSSELVNGLASQIAAIRASTARRPPAAGQDRQRNVRLFI